MERAKVTTGGRIVFGKPQTHNGARRICPMFEYGREPKGYDGRYHIEMREKGWCSVVHETLAITGISERRPSAAVTHFDGSLRECKKWLSDLIGKCYREEGGEG